MLRSLPFAKRINTGSVVETSEGRLHPSRIVYTIVLRQETPKKAVVIVLRHLAGLK